MIAIPAIDLKEGKVVRLRQGKVNQTTVYGNDPVETALHWQEQGARWLHLVDLDGAFSGRSVHRGVIASVVRALSIPVELGGGIRSLQAIQQALDLGVARVILGSVAITRPEVVENALREFSPEKIVLGVDAENGKIATHGWKEVTAVGFLDFLRRWEEKGIRHIIYTDISRDGMLSGPDFQGVRQITQSFSFQVVVSGGISSEEDVLQFCRAPHEQIEGVILGKALYSGAVHLKQLIEKMERQAC